MRWLLIPLCAFLLTACEGGVEELKSPCVGAKDSPCDRRAPAHQWPA